MNALDIALWGVLPYLVFAIIIGGTIWRYKFDQFGWTTRSSQLYESKLLRIASPMFHYGMLGVFMGHVIGLMVPKSWTEFFGITEHMYHQGALWIGSLAGLATLGGLILLVYRRRKTGPVFMATTNNDKMMYVFLTAAIVLGMTATTLAVIKPESGVDYRDTVSVWFRSIWIFQPDVAAMAQSSIAFKIHALSGLALFTLWPFTRLVHAFTAPLHYLFRPYVMYRKRDRNIGSTPIRRGWSSVGTIDKEKDVRK